jgi:hypothetical protein
VTEDVDYQALGLGYATDLRILLDKKTGQMICSTSASGRSEAWHESQQVAAELQPYWEEFKDLPVAGDLSEMMRRIVDSLLATSLRRSGGVYFVPVGRRDVRPARAQQDLPDAAENEVVGSSRVCLELKDANSRFCLRPAEVDGVNFICVVMPMRE